MTQTKRFLAEMTVIEITHSETAGKLYEAPGVRPVFLNQEQAIDYAQDRACFRSGEILDSTGKRVELIR